MSNFSIEANNDPLMQWIYYIENDVAMRMRYDLDDPLFLQKVSVLQAKQVKNIMTAGYYQTEGFRNETNANFAYNRQTVESVSNRIEQVGGMIADSLENGFAAMNYSLTDLSNKTDIANAYLSDVKKGIEMSNKYSQQLVGATRQLNLGLGQVNVGVQHVNSKLVGICNNLIAIDRTISHGFYDVSIKLSVINSNLDAIIKELKIPEYQRNVRAHIRNGLKFLAQATVSEKDTDRYFEDAMDEFTKVIAIDSKDFFGHYYLGYIYMYSMKHINVDKAIYHFEQYMHYARVENESILAKSLWDDACLNLSLGYYIKGNLPCAIRTIKEQIGNSEKVLVQHIKYLSLCSDAKKKQAMKVVSKLLNKNPYAVMMLLQDRDILTNPFLLEHIDMLRIKKYHEVEEKILNIKDFDKVAKDFISCYNNLIAYNSSVVMRDFNSSYKDLIVEISSHKDFESYYNRVKKINTYLSAIEINAYCNKINNNLKLKRDLVVKTHLMEEKIKLMWNSKVVQFEKELLKIKYFEKNLKDFISYYNELISYKPERFGVIIEDLKEYYEKIQILDISMIKDYESYFFSLKNRSLFSSAEFNKNIHSLKVLNKQSFIFSKLIVKNVGVIKKRIDIVVEKIKMTSVNMIKVEGGSFIMGEVVDNLGGELEQPAHRVTLSSYSIGETPVTQSMWITVMGSNPSHFKGDDLPVDNVSWNDCQKFIAKLNDMTGSNYRLPTEAEWEFAARGGIVSRGYKYSGSDNVDEVAWYVEDSNQTTHKIKTKKPNELGIYDMCGNVCEWCCDWFGNYSEHNQENPIGPNVGISRVLRGGCWNCDSKGCSVWKRYYYNPDGCSAYAGFRLVLS